MPDISNEDLLLSDIPSHDDENIWLSLWRDFALTFDGYDYASRSGMGDLLNFAEPVYSFFVNHKTLPAELTLSELRACLFMNQRMWRGSDEGRLNLDAKAFIISLLEEIRGKVTMNKRA